MLRRVFPNMKSQSITLSLLLISELVSVVTCQGCANEDHQKCIVFADPLLKDPHMIFPDNLRDIDMVCRTWSKFVDCIKPYIDRCYSKRKIEQFNTAVEAPIASIHQMCSVPTYQAEYLQYASCLKATVTETQHCGDEYTALVQEVSKGEMARASLCCTHHHFRTCVIRETRRRCDNGDRSGAASRFSRQILDRALSFLQDQCQNYIPSNNGDCHNLVTDNSILLAASSMDGKSNSRSNVNNNRRSHHRTLSPDNYAGQASNLHGAGTSAGNNPSFRSTSRSLNDLPKSDELDNDGSPTIVTSDAGHQTTVNAMEEAVTPKLVEGTGDKAIKTEDKISTVRHVIEEPAVVVTQRSPNYGRGMSWTSQPPKATTEIPAWATSPWISSNQDPVTESWYPAAGSFGGNNIDEPNQQGLKNEQMHLEINLLLYITISFTPFFI